MLEEFSRPLRDRPVMSEQDAQIVRRALEAFNERLDLDAASAYWHPEISWRAIEGAPDDVGEFSGHEALRTYYQHWIDTFDHIRAEAGKIIDRDDRIVAEVHATGRMKGSEAVVELRFATVYEVRDGLIVDGREYATLEAALAATDAAGS